MIRIRIDHFDFLTISKQFWKTVGLFDVQETSIKIMLLITKLHQTKLHQTISCSPNFPIGTQRLEDVPNCPIFVKTTRTIIGPKQDVSDFQVTLTVQCLIYSQNQEKQKKSLKNPFYGLWLRMLPWRYIWDQVGTS